jgi:hypothetical protein
VKTLVRLLAVLICMTLGIVFLGDIIWAWDGLPHSRVCGIAGLILASLLLVVAIQAGRSHT